MKLTHHITLSVMAVIMASCSEGTYGNSDCERVLWYDEEAQAWEETLPLGNGRLGMMTDGGSEHESLILNEISLWSGCETDYSNPDAAESLDEIRRLLLQGKNAEAQDVMYERFVPKKQTDGGTYGSYQALGALEIVHNFPDSTAVTSGYSRGLDLSTATAWTKFRKGELEYERTYYVSRTHDVIAVELSATGKGSVNSRIRLHRGNRAEPETIGNDMIKITGNLESGTDMPGMRYKVLYGFLRPPVSPPQ